MCSIGALGGNSIFVTFSFRMPLSVVYDLYPYGPTSARGLLIELSLCPSCTANFDAQAFIPCIWIPIILAISLDFNWAAAFPLNTCRHCGPWRTGDDMQHMEMYSINSTIRPSHPADLFALVSRSSSPFFFLSQHPASHRGWSSRHGDWTRTRGAWGWDFHSCGVNGLASFR